MLHPPLLPMHYLLTGDSCHVESCRLFVAPDDGFDLVDMEGEVRLLGSHVDSPVLEVRGHQCMHGLLDWSPTGRFVWQQ
jgi:hypothetical protein